MPTNLTTFPAMQATTVFLAWFTAPRGGEFKSCEMKSLTLQKRFSPLTRPVGPDKINRSVTLTEMADAILPKIAARAGQSVNEFIRDAIARKIESIDKFAGIAFRVALNAHTRQAFASVACLLFVGFIEVQSWLRCEEDDARVSRTRKVQEVRCVRKGRNEFDFEPMHFDIETGDILIPNFPQTIAA